MRATETWTRLRIVLASAAAMVLVAGLAFYPQARVLWHHHRLVERLGGQDADQRLRAAVELGTLKDARAVPVLIAALTMGDANTQSEEEVAALCAVGGPQTVGMLEMALRVANSGRPHVIEALACIDDAAARTVLAKSLRSTDGDLRQVTVLALSESRDRAIVDLLVDAEKRADRRGRLEILASLSDPTGHPLDPRLTGILLTALKDPDAATRLAAGESLQWNELNKPGSDGASTADGPPSAPRDARDDGLAIAARRASAFLAARQGPAGSWRTSRTRQLRFEQAYSEVNTYLTPMIVDMLAPVASEAGLADSLSRARKQIGGGIEESGLVRYYGPGAVSGSRKCAISFDADDTALAWRIAPRPSSRLLRDALATLRQYRTPNGLYRTWLAPADNLECIDRGSDPDPADVGIQMHILMLLAQASPPEGRALCTALTKTIADDRIWVYYRQEPLIPMIRQADLQEAGCPIQVPAVRIRSDVPGQGKWLAASRALARLSQAKPGPADLSETTALLRKLAQGDFLAIRRAPPLLYQNDATGRVPAFYWSQEFGYALWLRLYFETMRGRR